MIHLRRLAVALVLIPLFACGPRSSSPGGTGSNASSRSSPATNVLMIVVDTLRADRLETYGYGRETMPVATQLAREGALFDRAFCQATWTGASMSSLLTSVYPSTHGFTRNTIEGNQAPVLSPEFLTLAEILQRGGYQTTGHVTNVYLGERMGFAQGYETYVEHPHLADADAVTAAAVEDLRTWGESRERPLFLYVHYMEPHCPYSPPGPYRQRFSSAESIELPSQYQVPRHIDIGSRDLNRYRDSYDGEIHFASDEIKRLLEALDELDLTEETLVVLTSDHGEELFERGNFGHGRTFFEELLRIPLIFRLPGTITAGTRVEHVVELVDVLPTVLDLVNLPIPEGTQGQSLVPLLGSAPPAVGDERAYSELHIKGPRRVMARTREWKAICLTEGEPRLIQYYDLVRDPGEQNNLVSELPEERARALTDELVQWQQARARDGENYRAEARVLDQEERRRLEQLGYIDEGQ